MSSAFVNKPSSGGGGTPPAPMTRAALMTLRTASGLVQGTTYVITDFTGGQFAAGTKIALWALSANVLSMDAQLGSLFDNLSWRALYDIDANTLTEVQDNLGNVVRDKAGTATIAFDCGNTNITNFLVDNATWTQTIGSSKTFTNVQVLSGGTLTTTSATGSSVINVVISNGSTVTLTNGAMGMLRCVINNGSTVIATGSSTSIITNHLLTNNSKLDLTSFTGTYSLVGVVLENTGTLTNASSAVTLTGSSVRINNGGVVTIVSTAGTTSLTTSTVDSSTITISAGTFTATNLNMIAGASITQDASSTSTTLTGVLIAHEAAINTHSAGALSMTDCVLDTKASLARTAGSTCVDTHTNCLISGGCIINTTATSTSTFTMTGCLIGNQTSSTVSVQKRSQAPFTLNRCTVLGSTAVVIGPTTNVTTTIQNSYFDYSGINVSGTNTTTVLIDRLRLFSDATANLIFSSGTTFPASVTIANWICEGSNAGTTFNNLTNAGNLNFIGVRLDTKADYNVSAAAVGCNGVEVSTGGIVAHTGGTLTRCSKKFGSTLTTGAFDHTDIYHWSTTGQTLTANNTGTGRDFFNNTLV